MGPQVASLKAQTYDSLATKSWIKFSSAQWQARAKAGGRGGGGKEIPWVLPQVWELNSVVFLQMFPFEVAIPMCMHSICFQDAFNVVQSTVAT
jgi:hypothetical protein